MNIDDLPIGRVLTRREALALLGSGQVNGRRLLTHRFALDRIDDAFEAHRAPDSIKVALSLTR